MFSIARRTALVAALLVLISTCARADAPPSAAAEVPLFPTSQASSRIVDVTACLNQAGIPFRVEGGNLYVASDRRDAAVRALNGAGLLGRHALPDEAAIREREKDEARRRVALDERAVIEECRNQQGVRDCWVRALGAQGAVLVVDGSSSVATDPLRALVAVTMSVPVDRVAVVSSSGAVLAPKGDLEREKARENARSVVDRILGRDQALVAWAGPTLVVLLRDPGQMAREGRIRAACKAAVTVIELDDLARYLPKQP